MGKRRRKKILSGPEGDQSRFDFDRSSPLVTEIFLMDLGVALARFYMFAENLCTTPRVTEDDDELQNLIAQWDAAIRSEMESRSPFDGRCREFPALEHALEAIEGFNLTAVELYECVPELDRESDPEIEDAIRGRIYAGQPTLNERWRSVERAMAAYLSPFGPSGVSAYEFGHHWFLAIYPTFLKGTRGDARRWAAHLQITFPHIARRTLNLLKMQFPQLDRVELNFSKSFDLHKLMASVTALMNDVRAGLKETENSETLLGLRLDKDQTASRQGRSVLIKNKQQWDILRKLCVDPNIPVQADLLLEVWGRGDVEESSVKGAISRLRRLLADLGVTFRKEMGRYKICLLADEQDPGPPPKRRRKVSRRRK